MAGRMSSLIRRHHTENVPDRSICISRQVGTRQRWPTLRPTARPEYVQNDAVAANGCRSRRTKGPGCLVAFNWWQTIRGTALFLAPMNTKPHPSAQTLPLSEAAGVSRRDAVRALGLLVSGAAFLSGDRIPFGARAARAADAPTPTTSEPTGNPAIDHNLASFEFAPLVTTKLTDTLAYFGGPGGNMAVSPHPVARSWWIRGYILGQFLSRTRRKFSPANRWPP